MYLLVTITLKYSAGKINYYPSVFAEESRSEYTGRMYR